MDSPGCPCKCLPPRNSPQARLAPAKAVTPRDRLPQKSRFAAARPAFNHALLRSPCPTLLRPVTPPASMTSHNGGNAEPCPGVWFLPAGAGAPPHWAPGAPPRPRRRSSSAARAACPRLGITASCVKVMGQESRQAATSASLWSGATNRPAPGIVRPGGLAATRLPALRSAAPGRTMPPTALPSGTL